VGLLYLLRAVVPGDGMSGPKDRVTRIRDYLDKTVKPCKPGTILFTRELATSLRTHQHHGESTRDVGMIMRERDDVKLVRKGIWEKL